MTPKEILEPSKFFEMCKTPQGKTEAIEVAEQARTAYGVQAILDYLNKIEALCRQLTPEEQQYICLLSFHANHQAKHQDIYNYVCGIPDEDQFEASCEYSC